MTTPFREGKLPRITEQEFTDQVIQLAKLRGWRVAHFRAAMTTDGWRTPVQGDGVGFPDLILVRGKDILAIELKIPPRKTTREQDDWLAAFTNAGVFSQVWTPNDWPFIELILETGRR